MYAYERVRPLRWWRRGGEPYAGGFRSYSNVETTRRDRADKVEAEVKELVAWFDTFELLHRAGAVQKRQLDEYDTRRARLRELMDEWNGVIRCWRCGGSADVGAVSVVTAAFEVVPSHGDGRGWCRTPGCLHWDGTQATTAEPPTPSEIRDAANQVMDSYWRRVLT